MRPLSAITTSISRSSSDIQNGDGTLTLLRLQLKDKSSAVLLSEIARFVLPGKQIISDPLPSNRVR